MSVSRLVAVRSSAPTQKEATTVAVFLGTLWNRTSIPARPSVRQVFFTFRMSLGIVHYMSFRLNEMTVFDTVHFLYSEYT